MGKRVLEVLPSMVYPQVCVEKKLFVLNGLLKDMLAPHLLVEQHIRPFIRCFVINHKFVLSFLKIFDFAFPAIFGFKKCFISILDSLLNMLYTVFCDLGIILC